MFSVQEAPHGERVPESPLLDHHPTTGGPEPEEVECGNDFAVVIKPEPEWRDTPPAVEVKRESQDGAPSVKIKEEEREVEPPPCSSSPRLKDAGDDPGEVEAEEGVVTTPTSAPQVKEEMDGTLEEFDAAHGSSGSVHTLNTCVPQYQSSGCKSVLLKEELDQHALSGKCYKCRMCRKMCKTKSGLTRHVNLHLHNIGINCEICQVLFSRCDFRTHIRDAHGPATNTCTDCGHSFMTLSALQIHKENGHSLLNPFTCSVCGYGFKFISSLCKHARTHKHGYVEQAKKSYKAMGSINQH